MNIPVFRPSYDAREINAITRVLKSGWIGLGPKTQEFEKRFAGYIGVRYAVGVNSCTAALHLALKVCNVEGKEVITTPMTFVSTNHAILYNNGIPVFADIYPDTLNIRPESIKGNVTAKTKAIICVHYGGHACDMDPILEIAKRHKLFVIEDAAHACGSEYKGKKIGGLGKLGCFSFHAVKNLATGDGGMITTNDKMLYERLIKLRWLGITKDTWSRGKGKIYSWYYDVEELGFKYHMNDLQAALGLAQLYKLEKLNKRRSMLAGIYDKKLSGIADLELPVVKEYTKSARHNYVIKTGCRDSLNAFLKKFGISTGVHYIPNNIYEMYKGYCGETPVCNKVWKRVLTLPFYPDMSNKDIAYVIKYIRRFFNK